MVLTLLWHCIAFSADGEMATVEYLKLSCKICPWCKDGVNKLEGTCNYMTCRCGENCKSDGPASRPTCFS